MNPNRGMNPGATKKAFASSWRFAKDFIGHGAAKLRGIFYSAASVAMPLFNLLTEKQRRKFLAWTLKQLDAEANARGLAAEIGWDGQGNILIDIRNIDGLHLDELDFNAHTV